MAEASGASLQTVEYVTRRYNVDVDVSESLESLTLGRDNPCSYPSQSVAKAYSNVSLFFFSFLITKLDSIGHQL